MMTLFHFSQSRTYSYGKVAGKNNNAGFNIGFIYYGYYH